MGSVTWQVIDRATGALRDISLSYLFVEMSQARAERAAGTLATSMLELEGAFIRATFAAMQWGQTTLEGVMGSSAWQDALSNVQTFETQLGSLQSQWVQATVSGGFLSPQALSAQSKVEVFAELHPGLQQQAQMVEQVLLQKQGLEVAKLHLAESILLVKENENIARISEYLLANQMILTGASLGFMFGGPVGAAIGAAGGAVAAGVTVSYFEQNLSSMDNLSNQMIDQAASLTDNNTNLVNMNNSLLKASASVDALSQQMKDTSQSGNIDWGAIGHLFVKGLGLGY